MMQQVAGNGMRLGARLHVLSGSSLAALTQPQLMVNNLVTPDNLPARGLVTSPAAGHLVIPNSDHTPQEYTRPT